MKIDIQPAVKTETIKVAKGVAIGVAMMFVVFFILHIIIPSSVPFDYKVILGGVLGGGVAVLNFLLLGITVQKATSSDDEDSAKQVFKRSYRLRMLIQILWGIIALVVPFINGAAGLIPLLMPTFIIRMGGIKEAVKGAIKKGDD